MATNERLIIETLFNIADKDGNDVPFKLNNAQARLDANLTGRDIIPKARQEGISSYYLARALAKCLSIRNTRAVVISHESKATERMLGKVHYMLKHIRGPSALVKNASKEELTFPKMDSMFYIGTAGSRAFGRGDTITMLHCSEVALWENPMSLLSGLFQAVPFSGEISIESTGNGVGNWYHRAVMEAASGVVLPGMKRAFKLHFFSWTTFPEYSYKLTTEEELAVLGSLRKDLEEVELVEKHRLTAGQIAFRRDKLRELDWDMQLFKQEYPRTLDECFQSSSKSIFKKVLYAPTEDWKLSDSGLWYLDGHPAKDMQYSIGVDVAGGIGGASSDINSKKDGEGDRSAMQVICLNTMEQVGEWASNSIEPDVLGHRAAELGRLFNDAFLTVEGNNHGIVTMQVLREIYPHHLLFRTRRKSNVGDDSDALISFGFKTSTRTRPLIIGNLRSLLANELVIHSPLLMNELSTFVEHSDGKMEAEDGCFDDRVIAAALSVHGINRASIMTAADEAEPVRKDDPFLLENILAELHSRGHSIALDPSRYT